MKRFLFLQFSLLLVFLSGQMFAQTLAAPVYNPPASPVSNYATAQTVTLTCPSGSTGGYTTDGTTPTAPTAGTISHGTSFSVSTSITVASSEPVLSLCTEVGFTNSSVTIGTYTIGLLSQPVPLMESAFPPSPPATGCPSGYTHSAAGWFCDFTVYALPYLNAVYYRVVSTDIDTGTSAPNFSGWATSDARVKFYRTDSGNGSGIATISNTAGVSTATMNASSPFPLASGAYICVTNASVSAYNSCWLSTGVTYSGNFLATVTWNQTGSPASATGGNMAYGCGANLPGGLAPCKISVLIQHHSNNLSTATNNFPTYIFGQTWANGLTARSATPSATYGLRESIKVSGTYYHNTALPTGLGVCTAGTGAFPGAGSWGTCNFVSDGSNMLPQEAQCSTNYAGTANDANAATSGGTVINVNSSGAVTPPYSSADVGTCLPIWSESPWRIWFNIFNTTTNDGLGNPGVIPHYANVAWASQIAIIAVGVNDLSEVFGWNNNLIMTNLGLTYAQYQASFIDDYAGSGYTANVTAFNAQGPPAWQLDGRTNACSTCGSLGKSLAYSTEIVTDLKAASLGYAFGNQGLEVSDVKINQLGTWATNATGFWPPYFDSYRAEAATVYHHLQEAAAGGCPINGNQSDCTTNEINEGSLNVSWLFASQHGMSAHEGFATDLLSTWDSNYTNANGLSGAPQYSDCQADNYQGAYLALADGYSPAVGSTIFDSGSGTGQTVHFGGTFNPVYPPTSGPDNFYCSASNTPINGLSGYDDIAQGPPTCYNTALANTPTPLGYYGTTATSITQLNNILNGNGVTQVQCGQIILVAPGVYSDNNGQIKDLGPTCDAAHYIQIETADYAFMPAEGTRITPCQKGVTWTNTGVTLGYPEWNSGNPCSTNHVASFQTNWNNGANPGFTPALTEGPVGGSGTTPVAYRRWGPGLEFTRLDGSYGYAVQPTATTPGGLTINGCASGSCTFQVGVGDGTTQGGITSTSQSLSSRGVTTGTPVSVQSSPGENLYFNAKGGNLSTVVDDHDFQFTKTYANSVIGNTGSTITSITRTTGCAVTGVYTYVNLLGQTPTAGLTVFVEGVTDTSFNIADNTTVAFTSYSAGTGRTFNFGYTQPGGSCTASSSSGGGMIAVGSPTLSTCGTIPNNNCNGIVGQIALLGAIVGGVYTSSGGGFYRGTNHIIFDRVLIDGVRYAETDRCLGLTDTDHIAVTDSWITECHAIKVLGGQEGHGIDGGFGNNLDANAGTYKFVNNFISASGQAVLIGGGNEGFPLTSITLTSGTQVTGICKTAPCGIPSGTTQQWMAGSTLFPGNQLSNGVNQIQTVTCCTTTVSANDTFTFPVGSNVVCSASCTDSNPNMAIGGYPPIGWEFRRNWLYKNPCWNPLDPCYDGGGPLPSGGLPLTAKNSIEFKNGTYVLFEGNVVQNSWNTVDQYGCGMLLTPKAQGAPAAQVTNFIYRYGRQSATNIGWCINNALTDGGVPAYQGNTYVFHDNLVAQIGTTTLTCSWSYISGAGPCSTSNETADIRSSGSGCFTTTPNFTLNNVHLFHNALFGEVNMYITQLVGGGGTNPVCSFGMQLKDSILANGVTNIDNAGGAGQVTGLGTVSGTALTWTSGTQFLCSPAVWGPGTYITVGGVGNLISVCTDNTDIILSNPATNGTGVAWGVGGSCTNACTGGTNTPACKLNSCWNNPNWDYNLVGDNSANSLTWPGTHNQLVSTLASGAGFTNYNSAIPTSTSNWGSQFVLTSGSPGHNAADDGTDIGPNITKINAYTLNVDTLP